MKRKLLFSAAMLIMAAGAMAQSDVTPARYKFVDLPEGQFLIDNCSNGWGPGNIADARISENGYVNATGGNFWANKDTEAFKNFQSGWQILDLTEEGIGKVLCFKGSGCSDDILLKGTKATGNNVLWPQLAFYSDSKNTPTGQEGSAAPFIRLSVIYKAIENESDPAGSPITQLEVKAVEPNRVVNAYGGPFASGDMMVKDIETEEMFDLNEGWQKVEYDFQINTPEGNPFALSIKFDGTKLDNGAVLIKEIKFLTPTDGAYANGTPANVQKNLTFEGGEIVTGIYNERAEDNKIKCEVSDNILSVLNLKAGDKIDVYSVTGTLVASRTAASDKEILPINDKGFYIVRVGTASIKVANK